MNRIKSIVQETYAGFIILSWFDYSVLSWFLSGSVHATFLWNETMRWNGKRKDQICLDMLSLLILWLLVKLASPFVAVCEWNFNFLRMIIDCHALKFLLILYWNDKVGKVLLSLFFISEMLEICIAFCF